MIQMTRAKEEHHVARSRMEAAVVSATRRHTKLRSSKVEERKKGGSWNRSGGWMREHTESRKAEEDPASGSILDGWILSLFVLDLNEFPSRDGLSTFSRKAPSNVLDSHLVDIGSDRIESDVPVARRATGWK